MGIGLPSLSKRWFMVVARCHRSLAKLAVRARLRFSWARTRCVPMTIQRASIRVVVGVIAAAGRSGIEEVYGVPYLDVRCDVCFHVA
jgi:hypothetical protein